MVYHLISEMSVNMKFLRTASQVSCSYKFVILCIIGTCCSDLLFLRPSWWTETWRSDAGSAQPGTASARRAFRRQRESEKHLERRGFSWDPAVTGQRDEPRSSSKVRRASHSPHVADNVKQHEIGAIQDGDDDEEDSEQNTDEEHQSLDHHTWTQTQSHMRE